MSRNKRTLVVRVRADGPSARSVARRVRAALRRAVDREAVVVPMPFDFYARPDLNTQAGVREAQQRLVWLASVMGADSCYAVYLLASSARMLSELVGERDEQLADAAMMRALEQLVRERPFVVGGGSACKDPACPVHGARNPSLN